MSPYFPSRDRLPESLHGLVWQSQHWGQQKGCKAWRITSSRACWKVVFGDGIKQECIPLNLGGYHFMEGRSSGFDLPAAPQSRCSRRQVGTGRRDASWMLGPPLSRVWMQHVLSKEVWLQCIFLLKKKPTDFSCSSLNPWSDIENKSWGSASVPR